MEENNKQEGKVLMQYLAAGAASMNAFSMGCAAGWFSPSTVIFKQNEETNFTSSELSWISSSFLLFVGLSMPILGQFIPKIGNKNALIFVTPLLACSWLLLLNNSFTYIMLGRCFIGICGGVGCVAAPLFIGEMSDVQIRGRLSIMYQIMLCCGVLYTFGFGVIENKYYLVLSSAIATLTSFLLVFMEESPIYHLKRDRTEAAKKSLQFYRGAGVDADGELKKLQEYINSMATGEPIGALIKKKQSLKALLICTGFHMLQQLSGIKAVLFYTHPIFESVFNEKTHYSALTVSLTLVLTTLLSAYLVETAGRKLLLLISYVAMTVCHFGLTAFFIVKQNHPDLSGAVNFTPVVLCCLYILSYSLGAGPVPWAFQSEMFPAKVKFVIGSISGAVNWLTAFVMLLVFPAINDNFGMQYTFMMFGSVCAFGVFFTLFVAVETKGKTLEEIQEILKK